MTDAESAREIARGIAWGIIGTGKIAQKFASELPLSVTGRLTAVGSRTQQSAEEFGAEFGVENRYGSYQSLLEDETVDAVYIATPHPQHTEWAIKAARAGKHILCEKPLTMNHAWSMAVVEEARRNDVFLMEAYMYRCHPQTVRLLDLIREGVIGRLMHIEASFSFKGTFNPSSRLFDQALGGGGILDVGGYPVSMVRLLAGIDNAAPDVAFADPIDLTAKGHLGETRIDEWAVASLTFANGLTASVRSGVHLAAQNDVRVYGSEGYLIVPTPWGPGIDGPSKIIVYRVGVDAEEVEIDQQAPYAAEADALAAHIDDRQAPAMTWDDSLGNAITTDRWREAIGLVYDVEVPDADVPPADGGPLRRAPDHAMPYGYIPGVEKPISRLVMGVDNQENLPHTSVMFDDFFERGGNSFDTAWLYGGGRRERLVGQWINNRGVRDDVVIIGKGAHTPHCDPESITSQLNESLERLGTDYVDLYLMHRDNPDIPVGEFVDVLDEHQRAGRIRAFGGSNWTLTRYTEAVDWAAANGKAGFQALSNHFGLAEAYDVPWKGCEHVTDKTSRDWLIENQVPLLPWSSQARGFFARADPDDRSDAELVRCYYGDDNFARLSRARQLGDELGVAPTAIALAYVLHQEFPTFALIGPRTLTETRTSMEGLDISLTPEQVRWLVDG